MFFRVEAKVVKLAEHPGLWDSFRGHLLDHIDDINSSLSSAGMVTIQPSEPTPPDSPAGTLVPEGDDDAPVPGDLRDF